MSILMIINETALIYLNGFNSALLISKLHVLNSSFKSFKHMSLNVLFLQVCFVIWIDILLVTWWLKWAYAQLDCPSFNYDKYWLILEAY